MNALGAITPDSDPEIQRLLEESRSRPAADLAGRELWMERMVALSLPVAATLLAVLFTSTQSPSPALMIAFLLSYAIAARVKFRLAAGWAVPTQLVLVPMLFALPAPAVPVLVAAGFLLSNVPEYRRGEVNGTRWILDVGDAWHAVGPAAVFAAAGVAGPAWGDWPIYLAALGAEFATDLGRNVVRGQYTLGLRLKGHLPELATAYAVDAVLSPVGLLVAFASADQPWAFLLAMPLVGLIAVFAREREARIENALVLSRAYRGTAHLMAELLSTSHEYTGNHSRSVVILAHQVGERLALDEMTLREVEFGALLHDIGKWAIPNEIINKPGILTQEEMALMRTHTVEGQQMLDRIGGVLADVGQVVRSHHEFWDGSGYPDGIAGDDIPIASRIISACDAFNAMTTDRSYRQAMSIAEAVEELRVCAGKQFDPGAVEALVAIVETWERPEPEAVPEAPVLEVVAVA